MTNEERKFKAKINQEDVLVIENKDNWIKVIPQHFPCSGVMFSYNDNRNHHYDYYDSERHKEISIYLKGYELGEFYVVAGQTAFEVHPDTDFKIIPKDMNKVQAEHSGNRFVVSSNADGCIVYIRKKS